MPQHSVPDSDQAFGARQRLTISSSAADSADPGVTRSTPAFDRMSPEFREKFRDLIEEEQELAEE
jgi:hypothetical protein